MSMLLKITTKQLHVLTQDSFRLTTLEMLTKVLYS